MHFTPQRAACFACVLLLSACAGQVFTHIGSNLTAGEYELAHSQFTPRPTTLALGKRKRILRLTMRSSLPDDFGSAEYVIDFKRKELESYLALMVRFQEWSPSASSRSDVFKKSMGQIPLAGSYIAHANFQFLSSKNLSHYLQITSCAEECLQTIYLDKKGVSNLRDVLSRWANSTL